MFFSLGASLLMSGTMLGFCTGWAQKRLLAGQLPGEDWSNWIRSAVLAGSFGWLIIMVLRFLELLFLRLIGQDTPASPFVALLIVAVGGGIFGAIQGHEWRSKKYRVWWTLSCAIGWATAVYIGTNLAQAVLPYPTDAILISLPNDVYAFIAGTSGTVVFSIVSSIALLFIGNAENPIA